MSSFGNIRFKTLKKIIRPYLTPVFFAGETVCSAGALVPVAFYDADGIYAFCTDGKLYRAQNGALTYTGVSAENPPVVTKIVSGGTAGVLIVTENAAYFNGTSVSGVPYGNAFALFAGRIFIANGRTVYYSGEYAFTDFTASADKGGVFNVPSDGGEVVFMRPKNGKLLIVCENAFYLFTPSEDGLRFTLTESGKAAVPAKNGGVAASGGYVVYLADDKLFRTKGGDGEDFFSLEDRGYSADGQARNCGKYYVLPVKRGAEKLIVVADAQSKTATEIPVTDGKIVDGYLVSGTAIKEYYISVLPLGSQSFYQEDFDTATKKAVLGAEIICRGSAVFNVFGEESFSEKIEDGGKAVKCFVHGRKIRFGFSSPSQDFAPIKITVEYAVYGGR